MVCLEGKSHPHKAPSCPLFPNIDFQETGCRRYYTITDDRTMFFFLSAIAPRKILDLPIFFILRDCRTLSIFLSLPLPRTAVVLISWHTERSNFKLSHTRPDSFYSMKETGPSTLNPTAENHTPAIRACITTPVPRTRKESPALKRTVRSLSLHRQGWRSTGGTSTASSRLPFYTGNPWSTVSQTDCILRLCQPLLSDGSSLQMLRL